MISFCCRNLPAQWKSSFLVCNWPTILDQLFCLSHSRNPKFQLLMILIVIIEINEGWNCLFSQLNEKKAIKLIYLKKKTYDSSSFFPPIIMVWLPNVIDACADRLRRRFPYNNQLLFLNWAMISCARFDPRLPPITYTASLVDATE